MMKKARRSSQSEQKIEMSASRSNASTGWKMRSNALAEPDECREKLPI